MTLDRTATPDGRGKYSLLLNRKVNALLACGRHGAMDRAIAAIATLEELGLLDHGTEPDYEFFVIRLRDAFATKALEAYSWEAEQAANETGHTSEHETEMREYAAAIQALADKATAPPAKHLPD